MCPPTLSWVLPDFHDDLVIPCLADKSASVKVLKAAVSNHQHDFIKDEIMSTHKPDLIVW